MAYIRTPFAESGTRTAIPNDIQPDGSVSQAEGFGVDYQLDPGTDPNSKPVPRDKFNEVIYDTQVAVQQVQQDGFPDFITSAQNGGTPYPYRINATVRGPDGNNYYSLIAANTDTPPSANWGLVVYGSQFVTGDMLPWMFSTIRSGGWLWMNSTTIGSAASGATQRANADTLAVYTRIWNDFTQGVLQIQDSSGVVTARGISAEADFAANKRLPTPDLRGRGAFGLDNMGGATSAGRITNAGSAINGQAIGASGGVETVQLTSNQNGQHAHNASSANAGSHFHGGTTDDAGNHSHTAVTFDLGGGGSGPRFANTQSGANQNSSSTNSAGIHQHTFNTNSAGTHNHSITVDPSGSGEAHQNMPPAMMIGGWIMKL